MGLVLAVAVLVPTHARGVLFAEHFSPLVVELEHRLSGGDSSPRQVHVVEKALDGLRAPGRSMATDFKTARRLAKRLARAFPDEFRNETGLASHLATAISALQHVVSTWREDLKTRAPRMPPGRCVNRVAAMITKAGRRLDSAGADKTSLARRAKQLMIANRLVRAGLGEAGRRCNPCFRDNYVEIEAASFGHTAWNVGHDYSTEDHALVVGVSDSREELRIVALNVDRPGREYSVNRNTSYTNDGISFATPGTYAATGTLWVRTLQFSDDGNDSNDCVAGNYLITFDDQETTLTLGGEYALSQPFQPWTR
jgi:hypothetical protein